MKQGKVVPRAQKMLLELLKDGSKDVLFLNLGRSDGVAGEDDFILDLVKSHARSVVCVPAGNRKAGETYCDALVPWISG